MRCPSCDSENETGSRFCKACGARLPLEASNIEKVATDVLQAEAQSTASAGPPKFSNETAPINTISCGKCQHINPADKKFCDQCGSKLNALVSPLVSTSQESPTPPASLNSSVSQQAHALDAAMAVNPPQTLPEDFDPLATFTENATEKVETPRIKPATPSDKPSAAVTTIKPKAVPPPLVPRRPVVSTSPTSQSKKGIRNALIVGAIVLLTLVLGAAGFWLLQQNKNVGGSQPSTPLANNPVPAPAANAPTQELYAPPAHPNNAESKNTLEPATAAITEPDKSVEPAAAPAVDPSPAIAPPPAKPATSTSPAVLPSAPAKSSDSKTGNKTSPASVAPKQPITKPPAAPQTTVSPPPVLSNAEAEWYRNLKAELARCEVRNNFFSKTYCQNRALEKFCPNNWGKVKECVRPAHREYEQ